MPASRISLSTCCCSSRFKDGGDMLRWMRDQGFGYVELSHGVRITLVPGIMDAVQAGVVQVSSVHNFCPLPHGSMHANPNMYEPSSLHEGERDLWFKHTARTLHFAADVGAPYAVVHGGSVHHFWRSPTVRIQKYLKDQTVENPFEDAKLKKLREKALKKIRKKVQPHMDALKESIDRILPIAEECGVVIGLENREDLDELPLDESMPELLEEYKDSPWLGFWYDPGHAQEKHDYGMQRPEEILEQCGPHLAGVHFQDYDEQGHGHQAPGTGVVDFEPIRKYLKPETACVLELGPSNREPQIAKAKAFMEKYLRGEAPL